MVINKNKETLLVEGMSCSNCAKGIEKHLISKGLSDVNVNFSTNEASFSIGNFKIDEVKNLIRDLGYKIISKKVENKISLPEKLFYFTLIFSIPLFSHMFLHEDSFLSNPLVQFTLCLPVFIVGIWFFGKSALGSIKSRSLNMDVLITIGSSTAFFYSVYGWYLYYGTELVHDFLFFETSATIISLVLLGNVLEHRSIKQTTTAIKDLVDIQRTNAVIERDGNLIEIDFEDIKVGDILVVNSGDKIAVDGIIINGSASIDESMITGESIPVYKEEKNQVIGGTILYSGNIKVRSTNVGSDTLLSNIIDLVKDSQNNQPEIQKIGDKVSSIFVPLVLTISFLTYFFSSMLTSYFGINSPIEDPFLRAIAVLVISCPCAMGLATPTAVMVGIGRAAKNGILIKGGNTLEKFANIKHIFFDKTGTVTTGDFKLKNIEFFESDDLLIKTIIYNLETHSSHPIARSLVKEFSKYSVKLEMTEILEKKGESISAIYLGDKYTIGSNKILENQPSQIHDLYITRNNKLISVIDIIDEIKPFTNKVIKAINLLGINTTLLSGDKESKCRDILSNITFKDVLWGKTPHEKLNIIKDHNKLEYTAMIGDGINDAPSLSESTIGISIGGSTSVAIQSADIVLLNRNNLEQLPKALMISKHTFLTIKQNLFWAFAYNIVAIPVAVCGYLDPMWGALFMAFSDVMVIGNSIRLKYKKLN